MRVGWLMVVVGLAGCGGETSLGTFATPPELPGTPDPDPDPDPDPEPEPTGEPSPLRDTDGDGVPDDQDPDIDGDGLDNADDPDPDGDGQPGYSLPTDPADDPPIDPNTGLPVLEVGGARGRICAPNGTTWVSGASITILTPTGPYEATSNGDGWWQIDGLAPGEYGVVITKGSFYLTYNITIEDGVVTTQVFDECLVQGDLDIAAVVGEWDHVEDVLSSLGLAVTTIDGNTFADGQLTNNVRHAAVTDLLTTPSLIGQYDVVFLNCGISEEWAALDQALVAQTLRDFVEAGGSVYASDWSYYAIEAAFPDKITFRGNDTQIGAARLGLETAINGVVVDPAMSTLLGANTADIAYDLNQWVTLESVDPSVEILVEGTYPYAAPNQPTQSGTGPLSVRFTAGQGRVIYTTFHNEGAATTPDMHAMLEEIVLSL